MVVYKRASHEALFGVFAITIKYIDFTKDLCNNTTNKKLLTFPPTLLQ